HGTCFRYPVVHLAGRDGGELAAEVAWNREAVVLDAARLVRHGRPRNGVTERADGVDEVDVLDEVAVRVAEARPILVDRRAVDDVERVGAATADDAGVFRIRVRVVEPGARRPRRCGERRRYERER